MIELSLQQLGLGKNEIEVYLAVLKNGRISPANVARITKINRTTVYSIAKELIERGIITEDLGSTTRHLMALPPQDLMQLIRREERELEKKKGSIQEVISELEQITLGARYSIPKITFIGEDGINKFLRRRTPLWNASARKVKSPAFWGFQDPTLLEHYGSWIDWYWEQPGSQGMQGNIITQESQSEKEYARKHAGRNSRYWEAAKNYTATTWVVGEFILMIMTAQHPHYLVEVHDAVLAENMRTTFKGIWEGLAR